MAATSEMVSLGEEPKTLQAEHTHADSHADAETGEAASAVGEDRPEQDVKEEPEAKETSSWLVGITVVLGALLLIFAIYTAVYISDHISGVDDMLHETLNLRQFLEVSQEDKDLACDIFSISAASLAAFVSLSAIGGLALLCLTFCHFRCAICLFCFFAVCTFIWSALEFTMGVFFLIGWREVMDIFGVSIGNDIDAYCGFANGSCAAVEEITHFTAEESRLIKQVCDASGGSTNLCSQTFMDLLKQGNSLTQRVPGQVSDIGEKTVGQVTAFCNSANICNEVDHVLHASGARLVAVACIAIIAYIVSCFTIRRIQKAKAE